MDALGVVEQFGAAWTAHDLDAALALVTDDCVFDGTGPAPDGARSVGRDEIRAAWQPIFDDPSSRFDAEDTFHGWRPGGAVVDLQLGRRARPRR